MRFNRPAAGPAVIGDLLWRATQWVEITLLGDRPYVVTAVDAPLVVMLLMLGQLSWQVVCRGNG